MNNVLIGGTGFIGSALGRELIANNEQVVSLSSSGFGDAPGITPVAIDLYQQGCPGEILAKADNIFILIGQKHQGFDPERERQVLVDLAHALAQGHSRVFYFSTALVYGECTQAANEASNCQPIGAYSIFKLDAEEVFKTSINPERLTILRLANIYGSPKNKGFIGLLMAKLSEAEARVRVNGDGLQLRDYVFIDDLIQAILAVRNRTDQFGTVNIATGISHTLIQVIELVSALSGHTIAYDITHAAVDEPKTSRIDNRRLREIYNFATFTPLKEGLAATLLRYKETPNHGPH